MGACCLIIHLFFWRFIIRRSETITLKDFKVMRKRLYPSSLVTKSGFCVPRKVCSIVKIIPKIYCMGDEWRPMSDDWWLMAGGWWVTHHSSIPCNDTNPTDFKYWQHCENPCWLGPHNFLLDNSIERPWSFVNNWAALHPCCKSHQFCQKYTFILHFSINSNYSSTQWCLVY